MKITAFKVALLGIVALMVSCSVDNCGTKEAFLDTFQTFYDSVESRDKDDLKSNQHQIESEYKDIVNNCYKKHKDNLTLKERQDFWKSSVILYFKFPRKEFELSFGEEKDEEFNTYVEDELNQIITDSKDDFQQVIQDIISENIIPSLGNMLDQLKNVLGDGLKEFGNELEKVSEELSKQ